MSLPDELDVGLVGATLAGRFEILERLGRGGMGEVYRALDRDLDDQVALKVVSEEVAHVPGVLERFRAEVKLARRVTHRNVARTFELGHSDDVVYFTMELVQGSSLAVRLTRGPMSSREAIAIAIELCDALAAAHAVGVVHRDLKPSNVLLAEDGRVVLTDFGVATLAAIVDGSGSGSPQYMAPEQARGEPATPAGDIYALGLVIYEMLTAEPAFRGGLGTVLGAKQAPGVLPPRLHELDPSLAAIIARAIADDPLARWPSCGELRKALAPVVPVMRTAVFNMAGPVIRGLPTVQVLPVEATGELAPLVYGLHDELLRRLSRRDHLRLVRGEERELLDGAWVTVSADPAIGAVVSIRQPERSDRVELRVALEIDSLVAGAELASRVIAAIVGAGRERGPDDPPMPAEARAYLWRAREFARRDETQLAEDDYHTAARLAGDDPRVMTGLAMIRVRRAFFSDPPEPDQLELARELATRAIGDAPHAAEAHLAYGRVLLHLGDAAGAAVHLRTAMARAPYLTEPREWLGRLLLEGGFLAEGIARLQDVLEMDPSLDTPRWSLARAYALEGRWDLHDAMRAELDRRPGSLGTRLAFALRIAAWRRDVATMAEVRDAAARATSVSWFERSLIEAVSNATLAGQWPRVRDRVVAAVKSTSDVGGTRRRAFLGQILCEAACAAGDLDVGVDMLAVSVESGLFDRHWLEYCPLLADLREDICYQPLRAQVVDRAHAILDAYYGDQLVAPDKTVITAAPRAG